jgi:hypothetical protein
VEQPSPEREQGDRQHWKSDLFSDHVDSPPNIWEITVLFRRPPA